MRRFFDFFFFGFYLILISSCFLFYAETVFARPTAASTPGVVQSKALPLPRFVSLRAKAVNLHVGPGLNYPVTWRYVRPGLPVEILAEFDTWREIRDWEGSRGWVHKSLLVSKRSVILQETGHPIHKEPNISSPVVAHLGPKIIATLIECDESWCHIAINGYKGWIPRSKVWGIYPQERKIK